ncbi:MAG: zinc-binding dehydrogenase, partial [Ktedonobacteraceae bacterium]
THAVVVDPSAAGRLVIRDVDYPSALPSEALVRVKAISLNRGEVRTVFNAEAGLRPGWDLAGIVEKEAADGSGPRTGSRVVGMLGSGAWAEVVAVPTTILAEIPESVSFAQAATLPVAGLTALWSLERGGLLLDRLVLITGASGGVGHFACQLAKQIGARVVGVVRKPEHTAAVRAAGAHQVIVSEDLSEAREFGPYDLILESVGGRSLANALSMLASGGVCVNFGASGSSEVTFDARSFYLTGGASLYGFIIFYELTRKSGAEDLGRLAGMIADGRLRPLIDVEAPWTQIGEIAQRLLDRRITGKAVLHVSS